MDPTLIGKVETLAHIIWNEHFTPIIGKAQVDYMLKSFQSSEAISGQIKQGFLYYLIQENNEFIGYFGLLPKENELLLSKFYILCAERHKGYGKKVLHSIEQLATSKELYQVTLTVNKYNTNTIEAYEKLGFKKTKSIVKDIGHGFIMDDYAMVKKLNKI